ncbi:hypothetical protein K469DRAFT_745580 [Zopfia rhizophila CBS 207.26]|uniref:Heterokaryon incompatibility domain-containing protein n=1 Tax=Zopfia rhizophila CBS 207.26 TaxID=1314779 RepID=A0A6A6EPP1_9PEZI|nr:hypothetical protein K469DRAFT_745580 [Zopfia rhizophila CBS 207.26]
MTSMAPCQLSLQMSRTNVVLGVFPEKNVANRTIRGIQLEDKPDYICNVVTRNTANVPAIDGRTLDSRRIDFGVLREWLRHCEEHHDTVSSCSMGDTAHTIPCFRVINCETPRIIEPPKQYIFSAFSYVWGAAGAVPEAIDKDGNLKDGHIPAVVEDAITATKEMVFGIFGLKGIAFPNAIQI